MLVWLADFSGTFPVLNVFRYITFRAGGATATALLFVFFFGPADLLAAHQAGQGAADPHGRTGIASRQARHADHGRADDPVRHVRVDVCSGATCANPYVWIVLFVTVGLRRDRLL
jgi:phospho-N-acetylmuramoyl-pentapeptide-transferase